jgi:hypothetical protein
MTTCACQRVTDNNRPCTNKAIAVAVFLNQRQPVCAQHWRYLAHELSQKRVECEITALPKEDSQCQTLTE